MDWISVKDRLPEPNKLIGFYYDNNYHIGWYYRQSDKTKEHLWQSNIKDYNCICDIEFWFELLETPM